MSEMRELLEEAIGRLLADRVDTALLREAEAGVWPAPLWDELDAGGFANALVPEAAGGSGLGWADVHPLVVAAGEYALPLPLPEALLARWLLESGGLDQPAGPIGIADPDEARDLAARRDAAGWRLDGSLRRVPWGRHLRHLVLSVDMDGGPALVRIACDGLDWQPGANLAGEPRDHVVLRGQPAVLVPWPAVAGGGLRAHAAALRAAQTAGAMNRLVSLSVRYVGERVQFGRPIGQFQAVQQQLALLGCAGAAAMAASAHAFDSVGSPSLWLAAAAAKLTTGESAGQAAGIAHAAHGAIGFTEEHALHRTTRRIWSWRSEFGSHGWWSERLGEAVLARRSPLWHDITAGRLHAPSSPTLESA